MKPKWARWRFVLVAVLAIWLIGRLVLRTTRAPVSRSIDGVKLLEDTELRDGVAHEKIGDPGRPKPGFQFDGDLDVVFPDRVRYHGRDWLRGDSPIKREMLKELGGYRESYRSSAGDAGLIWCVDPGARGSDESEVIFEVTRRGFFARVGHANGSAELILMDDASQILTTHASDGTKLSEKRFRN